MFPSAFSCGENIKLWRTQMGDTLVNKNLVGPGTLGLEKLA